MILETYLIEMIILITPNQNLIQSLKLFKNNFKISHNRHVILAVVLKSRMGQYLKLFINDMRHDVIMSKQCGEPHGICSDELYTQSMIDLSCI